MAIAAAALSLLQLLGIIVDPTTKGIADSDRAMNYDEPR
jgi:phi LC3 family holin